MLLGLRVGSTGSSGAVPACTMQVSLWIYLPRSDSKISCLGKENRAECASQPMNELQFLNYVGWTGSRLLQNLLATILLAAPWDGPILLVGFQTALLSSAEKKFNFQTALSINCQELVLFQNGVLKN